MQKRQQNNEVDISGKNMAIVTSHLQFPEHAVIFGITRKNCRHYGERESIRRKHEYIRHYGE